MIRLTRRFSNQMGSASILIMLIMISLITFGLIAMLLSNSDYKMARKNAEWHQEQYVIESQAAQAEAALDQLLEAMNQNNTQSLNKEILWDSVGKGIKSFEMKGYNWLWQPEKQLATCQISTEIPGREMRLGFRIRTSSRSKGEHLVYDVVEWRLVSR